MSDPEWSARTPLAIGIAAVVILVGGLGTWSSMTRIEGAIVASGVVQVENQRQVVQHPDGGVVGDIMARDGDVVDAGDVLIRLDGTFLRTELAIVEGQLSEIFARRARLVAERDGAEAPDFGRPPQYVTVREDAVREQMQGQENLFDARRASFGQETRQLAEQTTQIERQIEGTHAQLVALDRQLELISGEVSGLSGLFDDGLVPASRLTELQREEARLQGEIGRLTSRVAEQETRITELEVEALRLSDRRREDAITRLRDLQFSEIELLEQRLSLIERLGRLDIRAPVGGTIFGSSVFARQAVVRSAEPMMYIVPADQPLQVSARIDPVDIDQVHPGQDATLVFTTFNRRTTPEVPGRILRVSADTAMDEATGLTFYDAVVLPDEAALRGLENVALLPGMPVETYLKTAERTPLSYLMQPLTVYFQRAFREE